MPVERGRIELCETVDLVDVGVDAVGNRDVNQAVVSAQGDSWLCTLLRQGVQP